MNDTKVGVCYSGIFQQQYKGCEERKTPDSFGRDDLPVIAKVADMAHTWIFQGGQNGNGGERTESDSGYGS